MQSTALDYLPIAMMFIVALGFVVAVMVITHLVGPKFTTHTKQESFECGIPSQGNARLTGLIEMFSFIGVFLIGFYYILKKGALTWE